MRLSKRAKRRIVVFAILCGLAVFAVSGWRFVRKAQLRRLTSEAHVEGMKAYQEGDYDTALPKLSYYLSRKKRDLEALLAFAETRAQIPEVNNRHLTHAIGLYRAALQLDPDNKRALGELLALYRRTAKQNGNAPGHVTLMVHTFVGDAAAIERVAKPAYAEYLLTNLDLQSERARGLGLSVDATDEDKRFIISRAMDRMLDEAREDG